MAQHTCFVISPIGEPDSDTRMAADDFFELIVQPAVEKFGFDVVRADKIAGTGSITEDVLRLVQESDLCIVDLSGHNPNVFYECGRRHETGRPYIQLINQSDPIPFDLAGIRTIKYKIGDARSVRNTVTEIQAFISEIEKTGFSEFSSGASISAIADTLARIERRLSRLESTPITLGASASAATQYGVKSLLQNPQKAMQEAVIRGDLDAIVQLLPRIEHISSSAVIQPACVVAINGIPAGAETLLRVLDNPIEELEIEALQAVITSLVQYYIARDEETEGCKTLEPYINSIVSEREGLEAHRKAYFYNQIAMLQHGARDFSAALNSLERAIELKPEERSYKYNISIIYQNLDLLEKACDSALESIVGLEDPDVDHLAHAVEVLSKAPDRQKEAEAAMKTLQRVDPARAAFHSLGEGH